MEEQNKIVYASVSLSRSSMPIVGLTLYAKPTQKMKAFEFVDSWGFSTLIHQLMIYEPNFLIIPDGQEALISIVNDELPELKIKYISRTCFESNAGINFIKMLENTGKIENLIEVNSKYFLMTSISGLLSFLENEKIIENFDCILNFSYVPLENKMFMTSRTIKDLELIESKDQKGKSLFSVVKNTKTKMGERMLRQNIMQPFTDKKSIEERTELFNFFRNNPLIAHAFEKYLKNMVDLDQLIACLFNVKECTLLDLNTNIVNCIKLNSFFTSIEGLKNLFDSNAFSSKITDKFKELLYDDSI